MGMDVRYGLMYGVNIWENLIEDKPVREEKTRPVYNRYTGAQEGEEKYWVVRYKLLKDVPGLGNLGELVSIRKVEDWIHSLKNMFGGEENKEFIYSYDDAFFFGFKAFDGEEPYIYPQNSCTNFTDKIEHAKFLWNRYFPCIEGKPMLYLRVSQ